MKDDVFKSLITKITPLVFPVDSSKCIVVSKFNDADSVFLEHRRSKISNGTKTASGFLCFISPGTLSTGFNSKNSLDSCELHRRFSFRGRAY